MRLPRLTFIDRKDVAVVASRLVSLTVGPLTTVAIGLLFSAELQGIYYSFGSIVAALVLFESGVGSVIVQLASRQPSRWISEPDTPADNSKLAAVLRFAIRWYWSLAGIGAAIVCAAGIYIFESRSLSVEWRTPWIVLCAVSAMGFMQLPFLNFLEGAGALVSVYKYRLIRSLIQSITLLLSVISGMELWAVPISSCVGVISGVFYLGRYANNFRALLRSSHTANLNWRKEVMPFQGRVAISWISGYFGVSFLTPVLLAAQGPVTAGRLGMTIALFNACTQLAAGFIQSQAPTFGQLASGRKWAELDKLFRSKVTLSVGAASTLIIGVWITFILLSRLNFSIAERVIDPLPMAILGFGFVAYHTEGVIAFFSRAQLKEPYYVLELVAALVAVPSTVVLSRTLGTWGVVGTFFAIHAAFSLPVAVFILQRNRRLVLK